MVQLFVVIAGGLAAYLWWADNRLLAWLALAGVAGTFVATSGLRTREARERALRLRNLDVLLGGFWAIVALVCVLGSISLLVTAFV